MSESRLAIIFSVLALLMLLIVQYYNRFGKVDPVEPKPYDELQELVVNPNAKSIELPEAISFAGEEVPLEIPDVKERLDKELHINTYWHNNTIFLLKRAHRWFPVIEPILKENGIPDDFKYLALIESGLENVTSYAGAVGFWQILKGTAKEFDLEVSRDVDERYHAMLATEAACKYLNRSYRKFEDWTLVAASYNRGMRGVERAMENQKAETYYDLMLNSETSRYVFRILAIKEIFNNPKKYGFDIKEEHLYQPYEYAYDTITSDINSLVDYAKSKDISYKTLKIYNPWLQDDNLNVRSGKEYIIMLPKATP
jgi:membrane-bound lytic murein transglycosylase D